MDVAIIQPSLTKDDPIRVYRGLSVDGSPVVKLHAFIGHVTINDEGRYESRCGTFDTLAEAANSLLTEEI